jgi:hypothetical protein
VLEVAAALEERKTISGDEVAKIMGTPPGEKAAREPKGWQVITEDMGRKRREQALSRSGLSTENGEDPDSDNGHRSDELSGVATDPPEEP